MIRVCGFSAGRAVRGLPRDDERARSRQTHDDIAEDNNIYENAISKDNERVMIAA